MSLANEMKPNESVANEIDYAKVQYSYPNYVHSKISPIEGSQTRTITAGGDVITFELPPNQPYNLAKSYLNLRIAPIETNTKFNYVPIDVISAIREFTIQTKGGLQLVYIPNFDVYTKASMKQETKFEDFLNFGSMSDAVADVGTCHGLVRNNAGTAQQSATRYDDSDANLFITENRYCAVGTAGGNNNPLLFDKGPIITWKIPLNLIYNTLCSLDKDLLFNETLQIRITLNSASRYGWYSDVVNNPTTNAVNLTSYQVTNPFLYLAMEKNESVVNALRQKISSAEGLSMLFDYLYVNRTAYNQSIQQQTQLRFNRANGLKLKKIIFCVTPQTETTISTFDISNLNGAKINNFYTMLNNVRRLDFNVSCLTADAEDWLVMREKMRGSVIQSLNHFQYNWVWVESFDGDIPPIAEPKYVYDLSNLLQGLDLTTEQKYDFVATTAGANGVALNHYAFSVCQKMLVINSNGIQIL